MLFRTHILFSLAVYFVVAHFIEMPFFVLVFVLLAAAFVDIDAHGSIFGNRWYFRPLQWLTRHRGIVHSLIFALLLSLVIASVSQWAGFGFFVGYISHLFLDCWTKSGVKLLWPLGWKIKGPLKSGSWAEDVIFVLLFLGNIFIVGKVIFNTLF